jgi:hypothetical protein
MWEPRRLTTLWAFMACYRVSFYHWSLSWARSIQSIPSHSISLRSILTLSVHLRLRLPNGLFPSGFPTTENRTYETIHFSGTALISNLSFLSAWQHWTTSRHSSTGMFSFRVVLHYLHMLPYVCIICICGISEYLLLEIMFKPRSGALIQIQFPENLC